MYSCPQWNDFHLPVVKKEHGYAENFGRFIHSTRNFIIYLDDNPCVFAEQVVHIVIKAIFPG